MAKLEPTKYSQAHDVAKIGSDLIEKYHPHLKGRRVEFLYSAKAKKTNGKTALGWAEVVSGLAAYFGQDGAERESEIGQPFFCITIWTDAWFYILSQKQRVALVDHDLCHLQVEEKYNKLGILTETNFKLIGHDLEEFADVVKRHGVWLEDIQKLLDEAEDAGPQLSFDLVSAREAKVA